MNKYVFDDKTRIALDEGIKREENVSDLEYIGLIPKITGLLERAGIIKLKDLLNMKHEDLVNVNSIGEKISDNIYETLSNYCQMNEVIKEQKKTATKHKKYLSDLRKSKCFYES